MQITAVVLCAGKGKRFKSKTSKPLSLLLGKPLVVYSLEILDKISQIKEIILVANKKNIIALKKIVKDYKFRKVKRIILGGQRRQDSVENALKEVNSEFVLIHDGVRPFIEKKEILRLIRQTRKYSAVILGVPLTATIKLVDPKSKIVIRTLSREDIWQIQTPQIFKTKILKDAYLKFKDNTFTDDASFVERLGKKVRLIEGSNFNLKVTTYEDLKILEALLKNYGMARRHRL